MPFKLEISRSSAAAQRANYHVDDLGHCATRDRDTSSDTSSDTRSVIFAEVSQYHYQARTTMTMLPFVFTLSWGCHTESPASSLVGLVSALFGVPCLEVPIPRRLSGFEVSRCSTVPKPLTTSSGGWCPF